MWELAETRRILNAAERSAGRGDRAAAVALLRQMSLDQFGFLLWQMPNERWPALSRILPSAPPEDVQKQWTGCCGDALLAQSFPFVRSVVGAYRQFTGGDIAQEQVLDFGCGYGRLLRLMEYFTDIGNLYGCDTWDESLNQCRRSHIAVQLRMTEAVPQELPYSHQFFGLVYAFSVFTPLPIEALKACLYAIRRCTRPGGLLIATIRPIEYWTVADLSQDNRKRLARQHELEGMAYLPHGRENYGDLSISRAKFSEIADDWKVVGTDWNHLDAHQDIMILQRPDGS